MLKAPPLKSSGLYISGLQDRPFFFFSVSLRDSIRVPLERQARAQTTMLCRSPTKETLNVIKQYQKSSKIRKKGLKWYMLDKKGRLCVMPDKCNILLFESTLK